MEKFLKVTNAPITNELISLNGVKSIGTATATATTVVIKYMDGTATTVTTAAQVAHDVYSAILDATESALVTSWTRPMFSVKLPKAVTSIVNA
tara:strand:- start:8815 stop:9093 length:279 start_codon:yes stop_codon:yes gene_type:complete